MMMPGITLPTGPFDWHPERTPRAMFDERVAALRTEMVEQGVTHAVVHGGVLDHGALTWLTYFTPKLGSAYALVPASGPLRLLFAGGPGMKPSAQRLTWVEDVTALRGIAGDVERWLAESGGNSDARMGLVEGRAMALGDWRAVQKVSRPARMVLLDAAIDRLRRVKMDAELAVIEKAAHALRAACATLSGEIVHVGVRAAGLAAERAAFQAGAQDVRLRIGRRPWQPPIIIADADERATGPVQVALALRVDGYWAGARLVVGRVPPEIEGKARMGLGAILSLAGPGADGRALAAAAGGDARITCQGIGLSLEEAPSLEVSSAQLVTGDVCSITIEITGDQGHRCAWSMMVAIETGGARLLWSPIELGSRA